MLARGALGNPWLFEELLAAARAGPPTRRGPGRAAWTVDRAREAFGRRRADRYLRKFYPWYVDRLGLDAAPSAASCQRRMQSAETPTKRLAALREASLARPKNCAQVAAYTCALAGTLIGSVPAADPDEGPPCPRT